MKNFGMEEKVSSSRIKSVLEYIGVRSLIKSIIRSIIVKEVKGEINRRGKK